MPVTIYHNPNCGTSRNTLAMIEASSETPEMISYLGSRLALKRYGKSNG